ncbi:MAG: ATP-binding protein [Candidatus Dormibacteria bacterium]
MSAPNRRSLLGLLVSLLLTAALTAVMIPGRSHLGTGTCGLVLIIPVVAGVAAGGLVAGVGATALGFLAYDFFFIRPYLTLAVSSLRDWVTLGVYVVVMLIVAQMVSALQRARLESRRRAEGARHLLQVSDLLIGDLPLGQLLNTVVGTVQSEFHLTSATVLLPGEGERLTVAAQAGQPTAEEAVAMASAPSASVALAGRSGLRTLALATAERPVGVLVLSGPSLSPTDQDLLSTYANHAAMAVERAQLREQALRNDVLRQVDSWRRALLGSVAHDLRTPLASIKAALSDLGNRSIALSAPDRDELLYTAEEQTDRLSRLVRNLLDMYRIEAGTHRLVREPVALAELAEEALEALGSTVSDHPVSLDVPAELRANVDRYLVVRVLVNLLENVAVHTPGATPMALVGKGEDGWVELSVRDSGPGVAADELERLFTPRHHGEPASLAVERGGVGLSICKAFVEANGGRISARSHPGGGLQVDIALPAA